MLILVEGPKQSEFSIAAKALGHRVHVIPADGAVGDAQPRLTRGDFEWGLLSGAASPARYQRIHDEARAFNITLLNDPAQHLQAEELDRTVAALEGLTARTEIVQEVAEVKDALKRLTLPVFIRGSVSSARELGWKACVAADLSEAQALVRVMMLRGGPVLLREMLPLRRIDKMHQGFPLSREYRLFVLDADVLAMSPYSVSEDPFGPLTERDEQEIRNLAHEVAKRTKVPWLAVDVGQLESGEWRVIETGDPSCTGLATVAAHALVAALSHGLQMRAGC